MELGASGVSACATHPVLSGPAIERLEASEFKEIVLLNTIPLRDKVSDKFKTLSVAPLFADAMSRVFNNESISKLFV